MIHPGGCSISASNVGPQSLLSAARNNMDDQSIKSGDDWLLGVPKASKQARYM
jgi:hypothetical protein